MHCSMPLVCVCVYVLKCFLGCRQCLHLQLHKSKKVVTGVEAFLLGGVFKSKVGLMGANGI